jgi:hypothetical protein
MDNGCFRREVERLAGQRVVRLKRGPGVILKSRFFLPSEYQTPDIRNEFIPIEKLSLVD